MSRFFSLEPMTRAERNVCMVAQVITFSGTAIGIVDCLRPHGRAIEIVLTIWVFAWGVGLRVKRQLSPKAWETRT